MRTFGRGLVGAETRHEAGAPAPLAPLSIFRNVTRAPKGPLCHAGSSLFRMGSDGAAIVRKQGRKAAAPAASSILTGRRLALTERAQVARIPTQIANSLLALRHRADARRTSARFAVRLIVAQLHGSTVSVLPTPNSEEPVSDQTRAIVRHPPIARREPAWAGGGSAAIEGEARWHTVLMPSR